ncbi:PTS sugar transporter subunit IIA [Listeria cossartiae]|uniref:PTS sugar transporter subunit IIA n=1 Tax=Listeria cossartiae TaxID=2838249 RepID=UPI001629B306|nr:PTS sugar transporter subunit IIA [Listeria cossartiae]MBC1545363.1 PTS sugar transporter subunit IIA [Listeria cossartiae subsp. cossartiae]MBC1547676.1 PTS sugar transporter subunit IIA [Listeria cossartiae subsp. cossartiae]MBC1550824.1 PTS sugar transporter subunit IIA [Listeria cossartiae subsp. cossartiae]MBC1988098.1 PTS sugar transporter subunit IIA [Listeria cossartiae subsp. cossartiae]MCD2225298.1 PTS sugar transporter subunit IIA [Listeria cossartiae]
MDIQELDISKVISPALVDLDLVATTKLEVIEELTDLLVETGAVADRETFIADVLYREEEGKTGLGEGVAIPHGKSASVTNTSIAVGRTRKPVEWESLDEKPVNIIILFAVKNSDATTTHIKLLQKVAILLADDEVIGQFQTVQTKEDFIKLLAKNQD